LYKTEGRNIELIVKAVVVFRMGGGSLEQGAYR